MIIRDKTKLDKKVNVNIRRMCKLLYYTYLCINIYYVTCICINTNIFKMREGLKLYTLKHKRDLINN